MGKETLNAEMITCDLCGREGDEGDFDKLYSRNALGRSIPEVDNMPMPVAKGYVCYICENCGDTRPIADVLRSFGLID